MKSNVENKRGGEENDDRSISSYIDPSANDLTTFSGAALIVADCMGTGTCKFSEIYFMICYVSNSRISL